MADDSQVTTTAPTPLLGGYAAKRCPVRTHNDYSPTVPTLRWAPSPEDQVRLDAGLAFEADVFERLLALHPDAVRIDDSASKEERVAATVGAMEDRCPLILGGWLPADVEGGRTGRPDVLVLVEGGYLPADVKHHLTLKSTKRTSATVSTLAEPGSLVAVSGWSSTSSHRYEDGIQLAHYTRMLQACGHHPGDEWLYGAILGTSEVLLADGSDLVFVWHDLAEPIVTTYSRSRGKARRSLLERYDHEHQFRVKVARTAQRITGSPDDPEPLVEPIGQAECVTCPYREYCAEKMGTDDASAAIEIGRLDTREWRTLRSLGIATTAELAEVDVDDPAFFEAYAAEVTQHSGDSARKRLAAAVERAAMIRDGVEVYRSGDGPVTVPRASVEIDVDVEYDLANRVYMWGARVRRDQEEATAAYVSDFTTWEQIDAEGERDLAQRFVDWLRAQRAEAERARESLLVFHWTPPEPSNLRRILGAHAVADLIGETGIFVDLERVFKSQFVTLRGTSIKKVAPLAGFNWRVSDPGGAISQTYLNTVYTSTDADEVAAAKAWLRSYNEDDNAAMAAIRDAMPRM